MPLTPIINLAHGPAMELNYQISELTSELRNVCDVMQGLSNTVYQNTTTLDQIIALNENILAELSNVYYAPKSTNTPGIQ